MVRILFIIFLISLFYSNPSYGFIDNTQPTVNYFTGRIKEIKLLKDALGQSKDVIFINGFTGIGKTQLIRKYASLSKSRYSIIWWFNCLDDFNAQALQLLNVISQQDYFHRHKIRFTEDSVIGDIIEIIEKDKIPTLFIYDDYNEQRQFREFIENINQYTSFKQIVISQKQVNIDESIQIPYFSTEEAVTYFKKKLKINYEEDNLIELSEILSSHPLSLSHAASFLNENINIPIGFYIDKLKNKNNEFLDNKFDQDFLNDNKKGTLIASVHNSFDQIKKTDVSAYKLLIYVSYFDKSYISSDILKLLYKKHINADQLSYQGSIRTLLKYSIIQPLTNINNKNKETDFAMHNILHTILADWVNDKHESIDHIKHITNAIIETLPKDMDASFEYCQDNPGLIQVINNIINISTRYNLYTIERFDITASLLEFYLYNTQYSKMQSLLNEVDKELHKYDFDNDNSKILFARYNKHKAVFHDFRYGNYEKSLKALLEADIMLQGIEGGIDTKFVVLAQLVQTYIYAGDLANAYVYLLRLEYEVDIKKLKSNSGLYYLVKAKYQLERGDYNSAKVYAQIAQETDNRELGYNSYTFPTFLISADIESRLGNIHEAYKIAKKLHTDYEDLKYKEFQLEGRLNAALADIECNLNLIGEAEHHILKANELYKKELVEGVSSIEFNDDLAGSYTILGDIRKKQNRLNEALEYYKRAEGIYINRYKNKLNLDMVGILFYKISTVASMLKDKYISKLYYNRHAHYFGMDHDRTRNIYTNYLKYH